MWNARCNRENTRETAPNSPSRGCPRLDASHKAHIFVKIITVSTIGHHELRLVGRLYSATASHHLPSVPPHNDLDRNHSTNALSIAFLTNIGSIQPLHTLANTIPPKKHTFNLHTSLQFTEFIRNSTRSQTGKMAAVDETFSTLVRIAPSYFIAVPTSLARSVHVIRTLPPDWSGTLGTHDLAASLVIGDVTRRRAGKTRTRQPCRFEWWQVCTMHINIRKSGNCQFSDHYFGLVNNFSTVLCIVMIIIANNGNFSGMYIQ